MTFTHNGRTADHAIDPQFLGRWSARAFTGEAMEPATLSSILEAARWAPSAFNGQPWRIVYAHRDTPHWAPLFGALMPMNQAWVTRASVLLFLASDRFRRVAGQEPAPHPTHTFDAGAAWGYLALQAHSLGWVAHAMAGFDHAAAHEATGLLASDFRIEAGVALGRPGDASVLPEPYRAREIPSGREPVSGWAFEGRYAGG